MYDNQFNKVPRFPKFARSPFLYNRQIRKTHRRLVGRQELRHEGRGVRGPFSGCHGFRIDCFTASPPIAMTRWLVLGVLTGVGWFEEAISHSFGFCPYHDEV